MGRQALGPARAFARGVVAVFRQAMDAQGVSRNRMAQALPCTGRTRLYDIFDGNGTPINADEMDEIAEFLGLSVHDVVVDATNRGRIAEQRPGD